MFSTPDWHTMFVPSSVPEVLIRGTLLYLFILILLRVVRRETGSVSVADTLVLVLIADAAQNGMAGQYQSVPEGMLLVATIVFWSLVMDWLGYRVAIVGRLLHSKPVLLARDGQLRRDNMRSNYITLEELMTAIRMAGGEDLASVRRAYLEGNGEISVLL